MQLLFLLLIVCCVNAHNWQRTISRSGTASTVNPAVPRSNFEFPHVHVGKGQKFQVEWATGHGSTTYLVLVKAEDEPKLRQMTRQLLDQYIEEGPADQQGMPPKEFRKYARKSEDDDRRQVLSNGDTPNFFKSRIMESTPEYIPRTPTAQANRASQSLMMEFKDEQMKADRFVRYRNPKWPFIFQVQRYTQPTQQAQRADFAMVEIPEDAPAGEYSLWYHWRGYYDITDVVYTPDTQVKDIYGIVNGTFYQRFEHCGFEINPEKYPNQHPNVVIRNTTISNIRRGCVAVVDNIEECLITCTGVCGDVRTGIMVAPFKNPAGVSEALKDVEIIPWGKHVVDNNPIRNYTCDKATFEADPTIYPDTKICVAIRGRESSETYEPWTITSDPADPFYYSTCYIQRTKLLFSQLPAPVTRRSVKWRVYNHCLDCDQANTNTDLSVHSVWDSAADRGTCVNCDAEPSNKVNTLDTMPVVERTKVKDTTCEGIGLRSDGWMSVTDDSVAVLLKPVGKYFYSRPLGNSNWNMTSTEDTAFFMAARDPRCSKVVICHDTNRSGLPMQSCACIRKGVVCTEIRENVRGTVSMWQIEGNKSQMESNFASLRFV